MSREVKLSESLRVQVEAAVLGGYLDDEEVLGFVEERVRDELGQRIWTEPYLAHVRKLLEERHREEAGWTGPSVNDAIDRAFAELNRQGIVAMQNAGYTLSDGWSVVSDEAKERGGTARGAVYFHGQDLERAVTGAGLMLAFGAFVKDPAQYESASLAIAREVRETLSRYGVETEWDRSPKTRIRIPPFEWRKRREATRPTRRWPRRFSCEEVLQQVMREERVSREDAIAALESFFCEAALKHYGAGRRLEAKYEPEEDRVDVFQAIKAREDSDGPGELENTRTVEELAAHGIQVEPGDELIFQIFYRQEDNAEAEAQDRQYGRMLKLETHGNSLGPLTPEAVRDGVVEQLRAARR